MKHELVVLSEVITWIVGPAGFLLAVSSYARQWPTPFRRISGWALAATGIILTLSASGWLLAARVHASTHKGFILIAAATAGLLITVAGVIRAVRTPLEPDTQPLRSIVDAVERQLQNMNDAEGIDSARLIDLKVRNISGKRYIHISRRRQRRRELRQLNFLVGDSGSGKSVKLRQIAQMACLDAKRRRAPKLIALHVDLASFPSSRDSITADDVYSCIQSTVAIGNTTLSQHLQRYLREPSNQPEWLILFDSFDELMQLHSDTAASIYIDAIRQFLSSAGPTFRAIIATGETRGLESIDASIIELMPMGRREIRKLTQLANLDSADRRRLLRQLSQDTILDPLGSSPLLLSLVCDHFRQTTHPEFPTSLHKLIASAITTRLSSLVEESSTTDTLRVAEHIAQLLVTESESGHVPRHEEVLASLETASPRTSQNSKLAIQTLIQARILRGANDRPLRFTHSRFQTYFAAGWLLRSWQQCNAYSVMSTSAWRESAIDALRNGSPELRNRLIEAAIEVLDEETASAPSVTHETYVPHLEHTSRRSLTAFFVWPPKALHVLRLLTTGLRDAPNELPEAIKRRADSFVMSALEKGMLLDQKKAIEVLAATTDDTAQWAVERAMGSGSALLEVTATQELAAIPHIFALLQTSTRLMATVAAVFDPVIMSSVTAASERGGPAAPSLVGSIRDLVRVGQIGAAALWIFSVRELIGQLVNAGNGAFGFHHLVRSLPGALFWPALVSLTTLYLIIWVRGRRGPLGLATAVTILLLIVGALATLYGTLGAIFAIISIFTADITTVGYDVVIAYATTWPTAMALVIAMGPPPTFGDWVIPQIPLLHMAAVSLRNRRVIEPIFRGLRKITYALVFVVLIAIAIETPLPMVKDKNIDTVRGFLVVAFVVASVFIKRTWNDRRGQRSIKKYLTSHPVDADTLLKWMQEARTPTATERLLKRLRDPGFEPDLGLAATLTDLAKALEHVMRMVPVGTNSPIPPAVWDMCPTFSDSSFRGWLEKFDKRYPGRLSWLATRHRGSVAYVLAKAENVVGS